MVPVRGVFVSARGSVLWAGPGKAGFVKVGPSVHRAGAEGPFRWARRAGNEHGWGSRASRPREKRDLAKEVCEVRWGDAGAAVQCPESLGC